MERFLMIVCGGAFLISFILLIVTIVQRVRKKKVGIWVLSVILSFVVCVSSSVQIGLLARIENLAEENEPTYSLELIDEDCFQVGESATLMLYFKYTNIGEINPFFYEDVKLYTYQNDTKLEMSTNFLDSSGDIIHKYGPVGKGDSEVLYWVFKLDDYSPITIVTSDGQEFECELKK